MNTPFIPEQIVFATVNKFKKPYFFAIPDGGGAPILTHFHRRCLICESADGKSLEFCTGAFYVSFGQSGRIAIFRLDQNLEAWGYTRANAWMMLSHYEKSLKRFYDSHPKIVPDVPKIVVEKEVEVIKLPLKPQPIIQGGQYSKYRARKMRQWQEIRVSLRQKV